jgi:nucleoid DNA-binding protein
MAADSKPMTEAEIIRSLAEAASLAKKDIVCVFEILREMIHKQMGKRGSGEIKIPKLGIKVRRIKKPATKARMGRNPLTGEQVMIAAKPARQVIKASALKSLRDLLKEA